MRVSERQRYNSAASRIEKAKDQNLQALGLLSSQKRINVLHDDPVGVTTSLRHRERIANIDGYTKNLDHAKGFIDVTESAIEGIHDALARAQELSIAMANDSNGPDSREATSREINELISQVIQLGNTQYNGRYIFSGFRSGTPALDRDGIFLGDDGAIFLQVEADSFKQVNIQGRYLFEATREEQEKGHFGMLDTLHILRQGMATNDKELIHKAIDELGFHMDKSSSFQATVGAIYNFVDQAGKKLELAREKEVTALSAIEDADIYEATSDFRRTEAVLQSTLLASNKLLQPSLLNFMQ